MYAFNCKDYPVKCDSCALNNEKSYYVPKEAKAGNVR
jgi:hypothetical protein